MAGAVAVVSVVFACLPGTAAYARPASGFRRYTYPASDARYTRDYWVYTPARRGARTPLVVYLHGCSQDARDAATGTRWAALAAKRGFVAVFPEQRVSPDAERNADGSSNGTGCWNWFRPENQTRGTGEPATIAGITRRVIANHGIDPRRVYVIGASAGANLATTMAAAYPDLYAAVGILAGCPYASCSDGSGREAHATMGTRARAMPVFLGQGTADPVNLPTLGMAAVGQWLGTNDLVDDGELNGSVPRVPAGVETRAPSGVAPPGDACIRPSQWPCLGGAAGLDGSYPYTVTRYADAKGRELLQAWFVHGLGHNYPGGDPRGSFTDPLGPDATSGAYRFFMAHPRR